MSTASSEGKPDYGEVSDVIKEPLLALYRIGSKLQGNAGKNNDKTTINHTELQNSATVNQSTPLVRFQGNRITTKGTQRKVSGTNKLNYTDDAEKLDQTRKGWAQTTARKSSKQERKDSISSEASLSDYEELGANHSTINGDVGSRRASR